MDRHEFDKLINELGVTKSVLAHIAGVWKSDVTDFTKGRQVSDEKKTRMISTLLELRAWRKSLQFAPSMSDPDAVRESVGEFRVKRMKELGKDAAFDYGLEQDATMASLGKAQG